MSTLPVIRMQPNQERRVRHGHPWAYANELALDAAARALPPGSAVTLATAGGAPLGSAFFNLHSLIAARVYAREPDQPLDVGLLTRRLRAALALRERCFDAPYYRLIHAEGDGLPGFVVDRLGDVVVCQLNSAGADRAAPALLDALAAVLAPRAVVFRNDGSVRTLEGLPQEVRLAAGELPPEVFAVEGGCRFPADPLGGQKTGWYFDLRPARAQIAALSKGAEVLDLCCHTGAFGVQAALAGARAVTLVDRSEPALALAKAAAESAGVAGRCTFGRGDLFEHLEAARAAGQRFDVLVADPPSFVKSRKDVEAGLKAFRKLAKLAAPCVAPGGLFFVASCSHHVPADRFAAEVAAGLSQAGREGRVVFSGGAGPDHPVHPHLPESAYIKWEILQLD